MLCLYYAFLKLARLLYLSFGNNMRYCSNLFVTFSFKLSLKILWNEKSSVIAYESRPEVQESLLWDGKIATFWWYRARNLLWITNPVTPGGLALRTSYVNCSYLTENALRLPGGFGNYTVCKRFAIQNHSVVNGNCDPK